MIKRAILWSCVLCSSYRILRPQKTRPPITLVVDESLGVDDPVSRGVDLDKIQTLEQKLQAFIKKNYSHKQFTDISVTTQNVIALLQNFEQPYLVLTANSKALLFQQLQENFLNLKQLVLKKGVPRLIKNNFKVCFMLAIDIFCWPKRLIKELLPQSPLAKILAFKKALKIDLLMLTEITVLVTGLALLIGVFASGFTSKGSL